MRRALLLTMGLALVASACGGGEDSTAQAAPEIVIESADSAEPTESPTTEPTTDAEAADDTAAADATGESAAASDEDLAIAFVECMRDEGIDFPDPTVNADGSVQLIPAGGAASLPFDPGDPAFDAATDVCGPELEGATFLPTSDDDITELQDNLLLFAQCLRDLGFDVVDPVIGGGGGVNPATLFGPNFDPTDPANADAVQECQSVFGAGGPLGGGE